MCMSRGVRPPITINLGGGRERERERERERGLITRS